MPRSLPHSTSQRLLFCLVVSAFIVVICLVSLSYIRGKSEHGVPVKSLDSPQQADAPLGFPLSSTKRAPSFDPRFIQLTAFERAAIPTATHMAAAMGTQQGALSYNAQAYWDENPRRGGHHTGDDFNGIGGMNTDLGDPVFAIANGLVIYRGEPSPGWGKTLILAHRDLKGKILQSMYAHLDKSFAPHGKLIHLGETIGTVGTANLNYPAHLHLEMRDSTGIHIGRGYTSNPGESINPSKIILASSAADPEDLSPCPLAILVRERIERRKQQIFNTQ